MMFDWFHDLFFSAVVAGASFGGRRIFAAQMGASVDGKERRVQARAQCSPLW
jgi:hypothetical protein